MNLTAREVIEAPITQVFERLTDFGHWERALRERRAEVQRSDALTKPGRGMTWAIGFRFRGKPRQIALGIDEIEAPVRLGLLATGAALQGVTVIELSPITPQRTAVQVKTVITGRTIAGRLIAQSLKLQRGRIEAKFRARVAQIAAQIGGRGGRAA